MRKLKNPFVSLKFVKRRNMPNGRGYNFWSPPPVPVTEAREEGRRHALSYLRFEAANAFDGGGSVLGFVFEDMIDKGDTGPIARGFLWTIAETLSYCAMDPAFLDEVRLRQGDLS